MANNRMWLVHRPTGLGTIIGKRMTWGWYESGAPSADKQEFFDLLAADLHNSDQDDLVLVLESDENGWTFAGHCEDTKMAKFKQIERRKTKETGKATLVSECAAWAFLAFLLILVFQNLPA